MTMREKSLEAIVYFTRYLRAQAACTAFRVYQHGKWSLPRDASALLSVKFLPLSAGIYRKSSVPR